MEAKKLDTSWMVQGRCRDLPPEIFFPSDGVGVEVARRYCAECPVKGPCLEYALENHIEHGVWGGASERERRRIARSRRGFPARPAAPAQPQVVAAPAQAKGAAVEVRK
jgi:WhiB family redox-sensing transcriptional regulator